jgi:hypothetical protein
MTSTTAASTVRRRLRDGCVAAISVCAVLLTVSFLFASPATSMVASTLTTTRITTPNEVVYGAATVQGGKLTSASVSVYRRVGVRWVGLTRTRASTDGTYRAVFKSCSCVFRVQIQETALGTTRWVTRDITVRPFHAYRLSVQMTARRSLIFLPIFSY